MKIRSSSLRPPKCVFSGGGGGGGGCGVLDVVAAWVLNDLPAGYRLAHVREQAGCALDSECRYSSASWKEEETEQNEGYANELSLLD